MIQSLVYLANSAKAKWFIPLLDVDHELSLPTIYSTLLFCAISMMLLLIFRMKYINQDQYKWHWVFLCFIFMFLCMDEGASIHELVVVPMKMLFGNTGLPGFTQYAWVIPGLILVAAAGGIYWKFYLSLPSRTKKLLVIAFTIYFSGLMGMEMVGAIYAGLYGTKNLTYNIFVTIEEYMEMTGLVFILYTFLDYVETIYGKLCFRII
ncbi:hypothetical protein [Pelolinea submarina]|uniref:hypothetical protein n=1 Tax=Pelolinea submarina TaxID=913107 RepID=UPI000E24C5DC|nr:hypothetical protein [Pelolinea submarina]